MGAVSRLAVVAALLIVVSVAVAGSGVTTLGSGADMVWVLRPQGRMKNIVVFGHGWSTPFPVGFAGWLAHLRARGSLVVYPRYRVGAGESTTAALVAFRRGLVLAFRSIGPTHVPIVAVGKSFGGSAAFFYAAEARRWGVPLPVGVWSIFPALPAFGVPPVRLPRTTQAEVLIGDRDTVAGRGGADALWRWLGPNPAGKRHYVIIRSRPGFVANHDAPQRKDPISRAVFWRPLDAFIAQFRTHRG